MAGKLVQVATSTVSGSVGFVKLTGIDSDNVYLVTWSNMLIDTDAQSVYIRVTTGGTPDSDSEYDKAHYVLRTNASFVGVGNENQTAWGYNELGTAGNESGNGMMYLYNFNNAAENSNYSIESAERISSGVLQSIHGGGVHTVAEANDGIYFYPNSGNFTSGVFTLYEVINE